MLEVLAICSLMANAILPTLLSAAICLAMLGAI